MGEHFGGDRHIYGIDFGDNFMDICLSPNSLGLLSTFVLLLSCV